MSTLIGKLAPNFIAPAVLPSGKIIEKLNFSQICNNKYAILFFYPLDFTFVCPSELIALNKRMKKLQSLNVEVITISIDSEYTHKAWRNTAISNGGIGIVNYIMISDKNHKIVESYDIKDDKSGIALRATFIIDKKGIIRHQSINDLPLGRNINELIRIVEALIFHENNGEVCPAGWNVGDIGIKPSSQGISEYLSKYANTL